MQSAIEPNTSGMAAVIGKNAEFVDEVTSTQSKEQEAFIYRIQELGGAGFPSERLLTASVGMCAEAGEFTEIVKKIVFQGKPVNEDNLFHLKRELGDVMWYVMQACIGLGVDLDEVIEMNIDKLTFTLISNSTNKWAI